MRIILSKRGFFLFFLLFVFSVKTIGQITTSGSAYVWSTANTWSPSGVPSTSNDVTVNNFLTLDQNLIIGTGAYTFNQDVTDQPDGTNYNLSAINASGSLTIASGTTTIGGVTTIGGNAIFTLTVKSGATLVLGTFGSTADNFLIDNKVVINIELGGTIIVYGNIVNSNSTGSFNVNGLLQVYGDYRTNNGNIDVNGTTGQFYTSGSMVTQGSSSTIYGSGNDCTSNCSGTSLGCGTGGSSYSATITPQSQTVCSGGTVSGLTFTTNAPSPTYQWESSSSAGGTYTTISGATSNTYTPTALTVTTWFRVKYTSTSCSGNKYSAPVPVYVAASTFSQSLAGQSICGGSFAPVSVAAYGTSLSYQWYSNDTPSNSGGTLITGASSNVYTPSSATAGIKYYYCVINSSCGTAYTTPVSGAFSVNFNTVTSASVSPVICVNNLMPSITHTTSGATGIGSATGLPLGVSAIWSSNTINLSGTPTESGTFNYTIPLTGGCGNANATGTIVVNSYPLITTQPVNQLDCEGASVKFKAVVSGTGLTYTWQYKRPVDADFITFTGSETNTDYPTAGEIKIENVGSAQYPSGTQFKVTVSNGSCSVTSNTVTLSVNEITDVSGGTNVTQCYGTDYSYAVTTSYPANVVSYRWKKSIASGVWDEISDGGAYSGATTATLTITGGTPSESAEYRAYITFNNSTTQCSVDSHTRTRKITFLPQLTTPVVSITQPSCTVSTGTITVAVQSITDEYSFDNGGSFQGSNVKSGMTLGTYNVIIKNVAGCLSPALTCQVISSTSTWNGSTWLNGVPDAGRNAVFQQDFSSIADIEACSCQVINGAEVVINSGHTLKVENAVSVTAGILTFENDASLVQVNNAAVNTGSINYKRYTEPVRRYDFTYWSSPVAGQTLKNLSPNTLYDKYYGYNPNSGWIIYYNGSETMQPGNGYSIRAPQTFGINTTTADNNPVFIGVPNNGVFNLPLTANKLYFLGNPYPSAIDADLFLDANAAVLEGTLYFWTHNTAPSASISGAFTFNYTNDDYAIYNRTGGVSIGTVAITGGEEPTGKIAAGQGFFAPSSTSGGSLVFNNSMRISGDNNQFFKLSPTSKRNTSVIEKKRIWLDLTSEKEGVFKQTLIGYIDGATNHYDAGFDGMIYEGNQGSDFYSVNKTLNLAIQGRALPFDKNDIVDLGYKSTFKGDFKISINHTEGILSTQNIYLEDKYLNLLHDLKKGAYIFSTEKGVFTNRFVLRYTENPTENSDLNTPDLDNNVLISVQNSEIKVIASGERISKISIYTISGQLVYQHDEIDAKDFLIQDLHLAHQVLIVRTVLVNNRIISTKIVY